MPLDALKTGALVFVAAILQVTVLNATAPFGGWPDLVLVVLVAVALLRGSAYGAAFGFFAGLVIDTATLSMLGFTSLLLVLAGYWTGRYGETTGRDRAHAPLVSVAVITLLLAIGALGLRFMLAQETSAAAVFDALAPTMLWNALFAVPVYALCRRILGRREGLRAREIEVLG